MAKTNWHVKIEEEMRVNVCLWLKSSASLGGFVLKSEP